MIVVHSFIYGMAVVMADVTDALTCPVCKNRCFDEEKTLQCDGYCGCWHHAKCVNLSAKNFNDLWKIEDFIKWFCDDCNTKLKSHLAERKTECILKGELLDLKENFNNNINALEKKINILMNQGLKTKVVLNKVLTKIDKVDIVENSVIICQSENPPSVTTNQKLQKVEETLHLSPLDESNINNISVAVTSPDLQAEKEEQWNGTDLELEPSRDREPKCNNNGGSDDSADDISLVNKTSRSKPLYSSAVKKPSKTNKSEVRSSSLSNQWKNNVVIGTSEVKNNLKSASRRTHFFVSRVSPDTTCDEVLTFLKSKEVTDTECVEIKTRFQTYKSFKVGVSSDKENFILDPNFWPSGVLVRHFLPSGRFRHQNQKPFLGRTVYRTLKT